MKTIICTTGTSISGGRLDLDAATDGEAYRRALRARVEDVRSKKGAGFLDAVSAETKSLNSLQALPKDEVYFLHTDTEDGRICAEMVAEILESELKIIPRLKRIKGLQVKDDVAFRRTGVDQLFSTLSELTSGKEYGQDNRVVLNVTGGFKSVVPYVTLFGLLRRFDITYIFEGSSRLIRMPPLPVRYDFERIGQAMEAIRQLRAEGVMKHEAFFELIPGLEYYDRRWYECLLEEDGTDVTLSAFAEHLLGTRDEERLAVELHLHARKALEEQGQKGAISAEQFAFMLERVADIAWRASKHHAFPGTDLEVYKPGNTPERMAGFTHGRTFFVCELYASHDEYEKDLPKRQRSQYAASDFAPWVRPSTSEPIPETEEEMTLLLRSRLKAAEARIQKAECEALENEKLWIAAQQELEAERKRFPSEKTALDVTLAEPMGSGHLQPDSQHEFAVERERLLTEVTALNKSLATAQAKVMEREQLLEGSRQELATARGQFLAEKAALERSLAETLEKEQLSLSTQQEAAMERERLQADRASLDQTLAESLAEVTAKEHLLQGLRQELAAERERSQTEMAVLNAVLNKAQAQVEKLSRTQVVPPRTTLERAMAFATAGVSVEQSEDTRVSPLTRLHAVAALVGAYGGSEEQMVVAVLNDALGNMKEDRRDELAREFGSAVGAALQVLQDSADEDWDGAGKPSWRSQIRRNLRRIATADAEMKLVWAAAQLRHAQGILRDLPCQKDQPLTDFEIGPKDRAWYYKRALKALKQDWKHPILAELKVAVRRLTKTLKKIPKKPEKLGKVFAQA